MRREVGASNHSEVLDTLKSKYPCVHEPLPADDGTYLTNLWVFEDRKVDASESPSFSNLMVDQNISDPHAIKEKIASVLKVLKFREKHVLVQFWSPVVVMRRLVLTTWEQPFGLGVVDKELYSYRLNSEQYTVVAEGDHRGKLGSPGRVYRKKLPEWSLDMHSQDTCYNIRGYINLPVFESSSDRCVGVLEIITSSSYVDFAFEVNEASRALKNQNLRCFKLFEDPSFRIADESRRHELDQILELLKTVCDIHNLPLAQTWAPSGYSTYVSNSGNLEQSCSNFNKNCIGKVCMSTVDLPWYIRDLSMWGFHKACTERHMYKPQGVVGRSLSSRGTWFCEDVGKLDESDYPLVHIARTSGLTSCLAIYLKSLEANVEYVIELFLPAHNANETCIRELMEKVKQQTENSYWMQLGIVSPPQVLVGVSLEPPLSPISLFTEKGAVPPLESENTEKEKSNSAVGGTRKSVVPFLEKESGDFDVNNTGKAKGKRMSSIRLEDIEKQFGMSIDEAAANLKVSRSTLKRICRDFGVLRWPKSNRPDKSDVDVVHTYEGALTHDPSVLMRNGSTHVPQQQEQANLPDEVVQLETTNRNKSFKTVENEPNLRVISRNRPDKSDTFMNTIDPMDFVIHKPRRALTRTSFLGTSNERSGGKTYATNVLAALKNNDKYCDINVPDRQLHESILLDFLRSQLCNIPFSKINK